MPSIPQSLLWISLVVLWLFVLVPMLISKRDAVRRTSDVALATRVLNSTTSSRLLKRGGPASGHRSDPDWRPSEDDLDETYDDDVYDDDAYEDDDEEEEPQTAVVLAAPVVEDAEPDYLDVDVIDEPVGALPVGATDTEQELGETGELSLNFEKPEETEEEENVDTAVYEIATDEYEEESDGTAEEYEYVEDSSGLEAPEDSDLRIADSMVAARRRRYDPAKAAAISARKYKFRKRMLAFMTLVMMASAAAAYFVQPMGWYLCGGAGAVTLLYLGYLRRQTRIEERLRRRRAKRAARARLGVENTEDEDLDLVPSRLRRPGSVVLEIDEEDPIFEHLEYAPAARGYDLPRAAGQ
ncbi:MAG TPA: gephyrin-like molybdotransferase receptor GlpR [Mycobacterium sp.]|nr:gephyrin-like molybdotransferase receptor GlpR [Mycobacterium sp.]